MNLYHNTKNDAGWIRILEKKVTRQTNLPVPPEHLNICIIILTKFFLPFNILTMYHLQIFVNILILLSTYCWVGSRYGQKNQNPDPQSCPQHCPRELFGPNERIMYRYRTGTVEKCVE